MRVNKYLVLRSIKRMLILPLPFLNNWPNIFLRDDLVRSEIFKTGDLGESSRIVDNHATEDIKNDGVWIVAWKNHRSGSQENPASNQGRSNFDDLLNDAQVRAVLLLVKDDNSESI